MEGKEVSNALMTIPVMKDLFGDVDFKELNKSIEVLAESSKELSDKEKEMAVTVVNEWEKDVVQRLHTRGQEMETLLDFFEPSSGYGRRRSQVEALMGDEECEALAEKTGTLELWKEYKKVDDEIDDMEHNEPEAPIHDPDQTYEARVMSQKDFELQVAKHQIKQQRLEKKCIEAEHKWKRALAEVGLVSDMIIRARRYRRNLKKFTNDCSAKGRAAKLNISISSKATRDALRELLDFAIQI